MRTYKRLAGFTLVELLVVIGIIALLIAIILPSLRQARLKGQQVVCMSNLKQIFGYMTIYCNSNKGYMFPVGPTQASTGYPETLGTNKMPHLRWPVILFEMKNLPALAYSPDPNAYRDANTEATSDPSKLPQFMQTYDARPYTPKVMLCPNDIDPYDGHSYVVNQELVQNNNPVRFSGGNRGGRSSSEIVVAGEKRNTVRDYHMERSADYGGLSSTDTGTGVVYPSDFDRVVEPYRHGISYGSNYLFLDGHVATQLPAMAKGQVDPWDVPTSTTPTTPPTGP